MDKYSKLMEILNYYKRTYQVDEDINDVFNELVDNNVIVYGDSFYCPIERDGVIVLLAGTKDSADIWVLKKIIKLIKTGKPILTLFNGNSEHLISQFKRYNINVIKRDNDTSIVSFNMEDN